MCVHLDLDFIMIVNCPIILWLVYEQMIIRKRPRTFSQKRGIQFHFKACRNKFDMIFNPVATIIIMIDQE
jgi:hypothetical protein